uniref:Mut7-C ubiquitin n=1 Tax=Candidatus Kentrum sp. MB TaxID=2138164 RepID=A0A451BEK2_9GAMM|nr:MAG: Mut7-C ubiquitin [Candidatus Kentron sp. MB]VFK34426.1 MAG: Mut7-C ubiquitin [Candidatus Kentron sp. MB]VFK76699.1 MAG: Mut7-C ubiquitin [Candidatus Kentron sp. MB]
MKIQLKLFASLGKYLPLGAKQNSIELDVPEGATVRAVLDDIGVPHELVKLVFVDGIHQLPQDLERRSLKTGETLAVWPPVAGG